MPKLVVAAHQLVRGWAWLYTLGLSLETRNARRTEIDSDLWDQTHAWGVHGPSTSGRCVERLAPMSPRRGRPTCFGGPLRLEHTAAPQRADQRCKRSRCDPRWGRATVVLMAVLVAAAIALISIHSIEYNNPGTRIHGAGA